LHLKRDKEGNIVYTTILGEYMYEELKLYLKRHMIFYNLEKVRVKKKLMKEKIDELLCSLIIGGCVVMGQKIPLHILKFTNANLIHHN